MRNGDELLCGQGLGLDSAYVHTMAFAERFGLVDCVACLKHQVRLSEARAERETTPTTVDCERASERVCREKLKEFGLKEMS